MEAFGGRKWKDGNTIGPVGIEPEKLQVVVELVELTAALVVVDVEYGAELVGVGVDVGVAVGVDVGVDVDVGLLNWSWTNSHNEAYHVRGHVHVEPDVEMKKQEIKIQLMMNSFLTKNQEVKSEEAELMSNASFFSVWAYSSPQPHPPYSNLLYHSSLLLSY
jgi:hypothetical protein